MRKSGLTNEEPFVGADRTAETEEGKKLRKCGKRSWFAVSRKWQLNVDNVRRQSCVQGRAVDRLAQFICRHAEARRSSREGESSRAEPAKVTAGRWQHRRGALAEPPRLPLRENTARRRARAAAAVANPVRSGEEVSH